MIRYKVVDLGDEVVIKSEEDPPILIVIQG